MGESWDKAGEFLLRWSGELQRASTYDELMTAVHAEVTRRLPYSNAWIYLLPADGGDWPLLSGRGEGTELVRSTMQRLVADNDPLLQAILASEDPVVVEDARVDPRTNKEIVAKLGNRTIINTRFMFGRAAVGILGVGSFGDQGVRVPSAEELSYLLSMAGQVSAVCARISAEQQRRDLEEKMRQTQRLESLGVLAGGIAHDYNNLMMALLARLELASADGGLAPAVREHLDGAKAAAERATDLSNQLLAYSGRGRIVVEPVSLGEIVGEMTELLKVSTAKKVELHFQADAQLPAVEASASQLRQLAMNLIINATEAHGDDEGRVEISLGLCETSKIPALTTNYGITEVERAVFLRIEDRGAGMPPSALDKLFTPFYSTKSDGRGLGMAAVDGILRGHQGAVYVDSEEGRGTTITTYFKALEERAAPRPAAKPARPRTSKQQRTLVLADDEPLVRNAVSQLLAAEGYTVLLARDGEQALELIRKHRDAVDIALLDLTMPRLDGAQTLRALRAEDIEIPVLLTSGYQHDELHELHTLGTVSFLHKPYSRELLVQELEGLLARG